MDRHVEPPAPGATADEADSPSGAWHASAEFLSALDSTISLLATWRRAIGGAERNRDIRSGASLDTSALDFVEFFMKRLNGAVDWYSPNCAIAQSAAPSPEALAAQVIVAMIAPNLMRADYAGAFSTVDEELSELLSDMLDLPGSVGLSMYSGTAAIYSALMATAREARGRGVDHDSLVVLAGDRAHSSIEKLARLCGLRDGAVLRLDPDSEPGIAASVLRDPSSHVMAIVGTAGSTDTGEIDDFAMWWRLVRRLREEGHTARVVCDAVLSWPLLSISAADVVGATRSVDEQERLHRLIESLRSLRLSDYFAIDFHKWAKTPLGSAHLQLRNAELVGFLVPGLVHDATRIMHEAAHELVVDSTRSAVGPVAAILNLGSDGGVGLRQDALRGLLLAQRTATAVQGLAWHSVPAEPQGPIVCLAPIASVDAERRCAEAVNRVAAAGGPVGSVRWLEGSQTWAIRFCFVHPEAPLDGPEAIRAALDEKLS